MPNEKDQEGLWRCLAEIKLGKSSQEYVIQFGPILYHYGSRLFDRVVKIHPFNVPFPPVCAVDSSWIKCPE